MSKILIVDDETNIRAGLREYAEFEGHEVTEAGDGMEAVTICREQDFDAIIMDVMMPKLDGFSACKEIRKTKDIPVLMLSARGEEYDKLFGFEVGVDDYVVKPFSPKEVMARLRVIISRNRQHLQNGGPMQTFRHDGLVVDLAGRSVMVDGQKAELTPKETDLLFYLVQNRNLALSRAQLLQDVWGYDFYGDDRTVDTHIKMLRSSLGKYKDAIVTLRGVGYKFEVH
ncbi:response regulator transcription factor [Ethanoligenens harbinense]|uniref:Stage 0 sporulation protein A homolog n=1 Tax=Ethanoligenens harbinense (strain DSM 18485 / JCM 12961 / CGMCC 1.5033 / YUAN-3) TaxID=663278 RepID=E6U6F0_ETHHY|nr:response regulator transcription factor [Ethanoligenens harbinense]ADU28020.1 two component transcriptional regulator, winged helix family [Ethanoligenens harbinense YUAN-3]AVQ97040.1 DNA-binding response regulator [Ethanoligenens harbinense YUAN-3]AYF39701.1 DNA-binding response regulator [Ethanoligenens harbinense]AYF42533.1 DNA-binding response regulator [Ethanoligenens harbinense]QCN93282.1 DNA-binding response regulator [Ethanoligenens harbinense]